MKTRVSILLIAATLFAIDYTFTDSLTPAQQKTLDSAARSFSLDDGCKGTMAQTHKNFICPQSKAFYNYAAWYAKENKPADYIIDKLRQHNDTYFKPKKYNVAPSQIPMAGIKTSPISIIAYISSDCPHCKQVGIPLRELALGVYKGKMSFQIKPIHHKIGDYALLAAIEQGKSWQLFEAYANVEGRLDEDAVLKAAKEAKLDVAKLKKSVNEKTAIYKKMIDLNYAEAKKNDMNFTPTLYFNGYMYKSNKHPIWIMEYMDFLLQKKSK